VARRVSLKIFFVAAVKDLRKGLPSRRVVPSSRHDMRRNDTKSGSQKQEESTWQQGGEVSAWDNRALAESGGGAKAIDQRQSSVERGCGRPTICSAGDRGTDVWRSTAWPGDWISQYNI
jgi:hypothetical protein